MTTSRERAEKLAREIRIDFSLHAFPHVGWDRRMADIIERAGEGSGRCSCFIPVGYRDIKCPQHGDNKGSSAVQGDNGIISSK